MNTVQGFHLIAPGDLFWRPSHLMRIPNADFLERTGSENLGARLWRLPPWSANTLHKHIRAEEFYFVVEGTGRMRVGGSTLTVPRHGGVWVAPAELRQIFNDTDQEVLWLVIGGPEELEFLQGSLSKMDLSLIYPKDPTELPKELEGVRWPPAENDSASAQRDRASVDVERLTREWIEAWNAHDLERILSHYADAVEFRSPFVAKLTTHADGVLHGKDALRSYFAQGLAAYPSLHFEFIRLYPGARSCMLEYRSVNNLRAAEMMEFDAFGKVHRVQVHYCKD